MNRADTLDAAKQAVTVDRDATHGNPEYNFKRIARIWGARLDMHIRPEDVAIMLIDLKTVRAWGNPAHADSWVDIAGYAACGAEISE